MSGHCLALGVLVAFSLPLEAAGQWAAVPARPGVFMVSGDSDVQGIVAYTHSDAGGWIFGYWMGAEDSTGYHFIDDPLTWDGDRTVTTFISGQMRGGFVSADTLELESVADRQPGPDRARLRRSPLFESATEPDGSYTVAGAQGRFDAQGSVTIACTPFFDRETDEQRCLGKVAVEVEGQSDLFFRANLELSQDGRFWLTQAAESSQSWTGQGHVRAGYLELSLYLQITDDRYYQIDVRGAKDTR